MKRLLDSVKLQTILPTEVLVIDSSTDNLTRNLLEKEQFPDLKYFKVEKKNRGLTKQRNFGIMKTGKDIEVISFLDDDIILAPNFFENLIATYTARPDAIGVGGYIIDELDWRKDEKLPAFGEFAIDGHIRSLGSRNLLRKRLGLLSKEPPGVMPEFSNGLSLGFLPPSGKTYAVEFFMGGVASYRKELFEKISFSEYFEGYGLYEDMDFCLRATRLGQLYVCTAAKVQHYHEESGRPSKYKYGRMVIRNGWYVWRVKYPNPSFGARLKWHSTTFLLTLVRLSNVLNTKKKKEAFKESLGRIVGWWSLLLNKPKHEIRKT